MVPICSNASGGCLATRLGTAGRGSRHGQLRAVCRRNRLQERVKLCLRRLSPPPDQPANGFGSVTCTDLTVGARLYSLSIGVTTNGVTTAHFIELPLAASIGLAAGSTVAGQVVRLYADPGSQITVSADVLASPVSCTFFVSGQQSLPLT